MNYLFEWTADLSVGQETIDEQHKQLLNQINIMLSAIVNDLEDAVIDQAIDFLKEYIDGHLKYEEEYMAQNDYPHLALHRKDHQDFIDNYARLKTKREGGVSDKLVAAEIEQYLGSWLIEHIRHVDQKYADFIRHKNA